HKRARGDKHLAVCTSVSEHLAYDVQHALLRLGIVARVRQRTRPLQSKRQGGLYHYWMVLSQSHEEAAKFSRLSGLCTRKSGGLAQLTLQRFDQGPLHEDEVAAIREGSAGECRCLAVREDHSFTANDLAVHN